MNAQARFSIDDIAVNGIQPISTERTDRYSVDPRTQLLETFTRELVIALQNHFLGTTFAEFVEDPEFEEKLIKYFGDEVRDRVAYVTTGKSSCSLRDAAYHAIPSVLYVTILQIGRVDSEVHGLHLTPEVVGGTDVLLQPEERRRFLGKVRKIFLEAGVRFADEAPIQREGSVEFALMHVSETAVHSETSEVAPVFAALGALVAVKQVTQYLVPRVLYGQISVLNRIYRDLGTSEVRNEPGRSNQ